MEHGRSVAEYVSAAHGRRSGGFTLIELMIVIAIIAIIAAIAIPNLLESRVTANEGAASASLKSGILAAEIQFQAGSYLDRDQDNVGEYGTLRQLAGLDATNKVQPQQLRLLTGPLANNAVWTAGGSSTAPSLGSANGFLYTMYVPGDSGIDGVTLDVAYDGQITTSTGPSALASATCTANNAERYWGAACVPQNWGSTGRHVFFIGADGQVRTPVQQSLINSVMTGSTDATALGNGWVGGSAPGAMLARAVATALYSPGSDATAATTGITTAVNVSPRMFDGTGYLTYLGYSK